MVTYVTDRKILFVFLKILFKTFKAIMSNANNSNQIIDNKYLFCTITII